MNWHIFLIPLTVLVVAGGATAQPLTVLPVDYGEGTAPTAELIEHLAARGVEGRAPEAPSTLREVNGVDAAWFNERVEEGTEAFFMLDYESTFEILGAAEMRQVYGQVVEMAANPELAADVERALLALGRANFIAERDEDADDTILLTVSRFPVLEASSSRFEPTFGELYTELRDAALSGSHSLHIQTPDACDVSVNGVLVGEGPGVALTTPRGEYAVMATCDGIASGIHLVAVDGETHLVIEPGLERALISGTIVEVADATEAIRLTQVVGDGQGLAVGQQRSPDGELRMRLSYVSGPDLAEVEVDEVDGAFAVSDGLAVLFDGATTENARLVGEQALASTGSTNDQSAPSIAPWIVIGVGVAGLGVGAAFAVVESSSFSDFETCEADPGCANSDELSTFRDDGESAGLLATVGFGVGAAAVITGVVLLILQSGGDDSGDDIVAQPSPWVPTVAGDVSAGGGAVQLGWRF